MVDYYIIGFTLQDCKEMFEGDFADTCADIFSAQVNGGTSNPVKRAEAKEGSKKLGSHCKL